MTEKGYEELKQLQMEYIEDVTLNPLVINEKSMLAPTIKAKWTGRVYAYRHDLSKAEKAYDKLRQKEENVIREASKVELSEAEAKRLRLKCNNEMAIVQNRIDDLREIIRNLVDFQKLVAFYNNDIKNALDSLQLEG